MHVVDTCGWIEWLTDGALADEFAPFLRDTENLVVPSLVQFELYKWCLRELGEAAALDVIAVTQGSSVRALDTGLALSAAELSLHYKLSMADAIVYATALAEQCQLLTSDAHFKDLPEVRYWPKKP